MALNVSSKIAILLNFYDALTILLREKTRTGLQSAIASKQCLEVPAVEDVKELSFSRSTWVPNIYFIQSVPLTPTS